MICETCEQPFADGAVKVFKGKKVCPSCFQSLTTSTVPRGNQHLQIIQTQHIQTTVCPECSAEVHIDTRTCPKCGAMVKALDRAVVSVWRKVYLVLGLFGFLMVVGGIGAGIQHSDLSMVFGGSGFGAVCVGIAVFGYRRNQTRRPTGTT